MHPTKTYELSIDFTKSPEPTKNQVKDWLASRGEDTFVEGVVDGLDLDFDYEDQGKDYYENLGGDQAALIIYKYDQEYLMQLKFYVEEVFGDKVHCELKELETQEWMEGWKESFRPFQTKKFLVYPPWEKVDGLEPLIPIVIEPGMAFGTGQHATTQLCLKLIESLCDEQSVENAIDVGTGTGILAIALKKLGCQNIIATDIDADAVIASAENAKMNGVKFEIARDSVPAGRQAELVIANILFVVIKRIFPDLVAGMTSTGKLLLSGILEEELPELGVLAKNSGLKVMTSHCEAGWAAILLEREL